MVEELQNVVDAVNVWPAILGAVLLFSVAPQLLMQLVVLLYPKEHPRRAEHLAELRAVPRWQRPFWVAETGLAAVFEAVPLRRAAQRRPSRKRGRRPNVWIVVGSAGLVMSGAGTALVGYVQREAQLAGASYELSWIFAAIIWIATAMVMAYPLRVLLRTTGYLRRAAPRNRR